MEKWTDTGRWIVQEGDLQPHELMQLLADFLERESVPYRVVGSMASIVYGEPRFTNDVDILIELPHEKIEALCREFPPPDFYDSEQAVRDAVERRHQFNILHIPSGLKTDMILSTETEFGKLDISQGQRIESEGFYSALFASPENVILKKLLYFKEGGSDKHLRDCASILSIQGDRIDRDYLSQWAARLGVVNELRQVEAK
jgi:hypothetical protein